MDQPSIKSIDELIIRTKEGAIHYINDRQVPGLIRARKGKGFIYKDSNDKAIKDKKTLKRINDLAIPPAWINVWISPEDNSHLQATGIDNRGRKQYLYHPAWVQMQQQNKFNKLQEFGEMLPRIRRHVRRDMNLSSLGRERVISTVVWLLENTFIRIGNEEYAKENNSFGLTTMRVKHVNVSGENINFEFVGKSGVKHSLDVHHPRVAKNIKKCLELPGYEIFQYLDENKEHQKVHSDDVNMYLQDITGEEFSAKDFRTWGGTLLAAVYLSKLGGFKNPKEAEKKIAGVVKDVSKKLGNKPSTCRNYYIHPVILESYTKGKLLPHFKNSKGKKHPEGLSEEEFAVVTLLKEI